MANSKARKRKQQRRRAAERRQQHNVAKSRDRDEHRRHLPKTGTKADDDYLMRRSREDVGDFGMSPVKRGWVNVLIALLVVAGLLGLVFWFVFVR